MSEPEAGRIRRILEKLEKVLRQGLTCFGWHRHGFRLNPPINEAELIRFEEEHRISLPGDYRSFLKLAGNGGAGPYYGIYTLDSWRAFLAGTTDEMPADILHLRSPLHPQMSREASWESQFSNCVSPYQGMIAIGEQGCTYAMGLIVTGEFAGRVVYLDANGQAPYVVREPDFLSWYERWLDELLGGYDTDWFGFGIVGDESQLLKSLEDQTSSENDRIEAVRAMRRLPELSPTGRKCICGMMRDSVASIRVAACAVVERFKIVEAKQFVTEMLVDESSDVRWAAIGMCAALTCQIDRVDLFSLLQSDDLTAARRAFLKLQERGEIPRHILLALLQSDPHSGLRYLYIHAINWLPEDVSVLIRLLRDADSEVRFYAVLGLRQIRMISSLNAVIDLLSHESSCNTIESILRMLGEVHGEENAEVLLAWTQKGDDFQRITAIDSLCKLGDMRVVPVAKSHLEVKRPPLRRDEKDITTFSHKKRICDLVRASLRSSPNAELRSLVSFHNWLRALVFWKQAR